MCANYLLYIAWKCFQPIKKFRLQCSKERRASTYSMVGNVRCINKDITLYKYKYPIYFAPQAVYLGLAYSMSILRFFVSNSAIFLGLQLNQSSMETERDLFHISVAVFK